MTRVTVPFFISHQGCPRGCVFCDQNLISGSSGTLPDNDEIVARILAWYDTARGRPLEVAFFGGSFTALPLPVQERLLATVQPFLHNGCVASIRVSTRPDALDPENVPWLAQRGVATVELGVQSMEDAVLEASGRGHDSRASRNAIRLLKEHKLRTGAQLMPGLPGDTPETALASLEEVIDAGIDFLRIYPTVVLRGTELARRYQQGTYQPLDLTEGVALCATLLRVALRRDIPVIRLGLQDDESIRNGAILAGCWHPALGQLVWCELYYDLVLRLVNALPDRSCPVTVSCHPSRISNVIGHKRSTLNRLRQGGFDITAVRADQSLSPHECRISTDLATLQGSVLDEAGAGSA